MIKSLKILVALAAIAAAGATSASAATMSGHIRSINAPAHRIVLRHHVFHLTNAVKAGSVRKGEHVRLTYHWSHGKRWVTAWKPIAGKKARATNAAIHLKMKAEPKTNANTY